MKIKIVLNPVSGGGISLKVWKVVQAELIKKNIEFDFEETTKDKSAKEIVKESLKNKYNWIIGIGGDGTLSNIINGFFENGKPINENAVFSPIPAGRGNDFVKTVKIPRNPLKAITQVLAGEVKKIDLIKIVYSHADKSKGEGYCLNLTDFGMGGEVVYKVNQSALGRWIGGKAVFLLYTIVCLFTYKNKLMRLKLSNGEFIESKSRLIVCANAEYAGGGMWFAPKAKLNDGLFDFLAIKDVGVFETMMKFSKLYKGKLAEEEKVACRQISSLEAESDEDVFIDVDGENMGQLPAKFTIFPNAISIKC
ncbi:MAG: diacylglycerol kinase family lipid kinase [Leptospira sp.]|nr:diacylglycerol kinase family lipid kinase [Leptospira sp.]